jgi:hypothetical protein
VRSDSSTISFHSSAGRSASAALRSKLGSQKTESVIAPSASITRIVAGGSLRTPDRIVRGGGTTACQDM